MFVIIMIFVLSFFFCPFLSYTELNARLLFILAHLDRLFCFCFFSLFLFLSLFRSLEDAYSVYSAEQSKMLKSYFLLCLFGWLVHIDHLSHILLLCQSDVCSWLCCCC